MKKPLPIVLSLGFVLGFALLPLLPLPPGASLHAADPVPPAGASEKKALPPIGSQALTRRVTFQGKIDATDRIIIQDGKLRIEHVDWERPSDLSIDGKTWKPVWNGKNTDEFSDFRPPLAPFTGATVTLKQRKGRGESAILEQPTEKNGHKLIIQVRDAGNGASEFELRISW